MNNTISLEQQRLLNLDIKFTGNRFEVKTNLLIKQNYVIGLLTNIINYLGSSQNEVFRAGDSTEKINTVFDVLGNLEDVELNIKITKPIYLTTLESSLITIAVDRDVRQYTFIAVLEKLKYKLITSSTNTLIPNNVIIR